MSVVKEAAERVRAYLEAHNRLFPGSDEICAISDLEGIIKLRATDIAALSAFADTMVSTKPDHKIPQTPIVGMHFALRSGGVACGTDQDEMVSTSDPVQVDCRNCLIAIAGS